MLFRRIDDRGQIKTDQAHYAQSYPHFVSRRESTKVVSHLSMLFGEGYLKPEEGTQLGEQGSPAWLQKIKVFDFFFHVLTQPFDDFFLQLPGALPRNVIFAPNIVEGHGVF